MITHANADLARFIRQVYPLPASDDQLAALEAALRATELERKRLDAAKAGAEGVTASLPGRGSGTRTAGRPGRRAGRRRG